MNNYIATPYNQADPAWGSQFLGHTVSTMRRYGCYTTFAASVLAGTFHQRNKESQPVTPGDLCTMLNAIGGYNGDQIGWNSVQRLYPDCSLWAAGYTSNMKGNNITKVDIVTALGRVARACRLGQGVGLCVDRVTNDLVVPDHIVALVHAPENPMDWMIMDPDGGQVMRFYDRYGLPRDGVYGYRIMAGPPTEFPDYATEQDKSDGIAFWKAVEVARGQNVQTYAKEIAQSLMFPL